ncbi:MAG: 2-oxo acid dehydrogenase subunit E2, partial [Chromatiaceae bacterium]
MPPGCAGAPADATGSRWWSACLTGAALKAFPYFNASLDLDDESIILKRYYHIGVAVATERGLL